MGKGIVNKSEPSLDLKRLTQLIKKAKKASSWLKQIEISTLHSDDAGELGEALGDTRDVLYEFAKTSRLKWCECEDRDVAENPNTMSSRLPGEGCLDDYKELG